MKEKIKIEKIKTKIKIENVWLIHYSEIMLKGGNRTKFENKLMDNIRLVFKKQGFDVNVKKIESRIVLFIKNKGKIDAADLLSRVPGIDDFSKAYIVDSNFNEIKQVVMKLVEQDLKRERFDKFRIEVKRSWKGFPLTSLDVKKKLADEIMQKFKLKLDLNNGKPFFVQITKQKSFVYDNKLKGVGGLPSGTSAKVLSLISGGIDSPVAAFLMMKRGCQLDFIHFHNFTVNRKIVKDKVVKLVKKLSLGQPKTRLFMIPFEDLQLNIVQHVPDRYRMLIYRMFMFKIANQIKGYLGFVSGDSVGQVASQTLENLRCVYDAAERQVLTPLIGMNKQETINIARKIGTYEISILPYSDLCSMLVSKHPVTKARLKDVIAIEQKLYEKVDVDKLISEAVKKVKVYEF